MSAADESTVAVCGAEKLQALGSVDCYPVPAASVELIETHFAWVFLVGDHAYKMKKPVALPLLDLRSVADRHHNCLEEVRLNRRLAPDVYLGAVPLILDQHGALKVGGEGNAVDWLVWMKRLPAQSMLDRAIADRTVTMAALNEVGALLARFYEGQPRFFMPARHYIAQLFERTVAEGQALLAPELKLDMEKVGTAVAAVDASLRSLQPELASRAVDGRVRECHGDLRPEHICLAPLCVIDSLEFSRELRILDPPRSSHSYALNVWWQARRRWLSRSWPRISNHLAIRARGACWIAIRVVEHWYVQRFSRGTYSIRRWQRSRRGQKRLTRMLSWPSDMRDRRAAPRLEVQECAK